MKQIPWLLYAYIGKELVVATALSLVSLSLLVIIVFGFRAVSDGFDLQVVMPWILGCVGFSLYLTLPISLLFASTLVYGRLAADREFTALCASGVTPLHLYGPMAILSTLACIVALNTVGTVFADAHYAQRNIARFLIKQLENMGKGEKRLFRFEEGQVFCEQVFNQHLRGVTIKKSIELEPTAEEKIDPNFKPRTTTLVIDARFADVTLDPVTNRILLDLTDFQISIPDTDAGFLSEEANWYSHNRIVRAKGKMQVGFEIGSRKKGTADMTTTELAASSEEYEKLLETERENVKLFSTQKNTQESPSAREEAGKSLEKAEAAVTYLQYRLRRNDSEVWKRRAMALALLTFPLVGFPVSLTLRYRHRLVSFFFGNLIVMIVFHPLMVAGEVLAEEGWLPAAIANSASNFVLAIIGVLLFGRLLWR